jgi:hypothetical protein
LITKGTNQIILDAITQPSSMAVAIENPAIRKSGKVN